MYFDFLKNNEKKERDLAEVMKDLKEILAIVFNLKENFETYDLHGNVFTVRPPYIDQAKCIFLTIHRNKLSSTFEIERFCEKSDITEIIRLHLKSLAESEAKNETGSGADNAKNI